MQGGKYKQMVNVGDSWVVQLTGRESPSQESIKSQKELGRLGSAYESFQMSG